MEVYVEDIDTEDNEMEGENDVIEQDRRKHMTPHGDEMMHSKVIQEARGEDGNPTGSRNNNLTLDMYEYEVTFLDGLTV